MKSDFFFYGLFIAAFFAIAVSSHARAQTMQGVYTVGGASGNDYPVLDSAVADLYNLGVAGNVEFWLDGQTFMSPLYMNGTLLNPTGANIVFKTNPSAGQMAEVISPSIPVHLISVNNISLDSLRIQTTGFSSVVRIEGYTENITVRRCTIIGSLSAGGNWNEAAILKRHGGYHTTNYFTVEDNHIRYGTYGIYAGGTTITDQHGLVLKSNSIDSVSHVGIFAEGWDTATIQENTLTKHSIYGGLGIQLDEVHNFNVSKNVLTMCGMDFHWCNTLPGQEGVVSNNYISYTGVLQAKAIDIDVSHNLLIAHNTVEVQSQDTTWARPLNLFNADSIQVLNNIFMNHSSGRMFSSNLNHEPRRSNGNNFYSSTSSPRFYNPSGSYTGILSWTQFSNNDSNSLNNNPLLTGTPGYIPNSALLADQGISGLGILDDILGQMRGATPDIGCVEFLPPSDYIVFSWEDSIVCVGADSLLLRVYNAGNNTVDSAKIHLTWDSLSGGSNLTEFTLGSIPAGGNVLVKISSYMTIVDTASLQVKSTSVNGNVPSSVDSVFVSSIFGRRPNIHMPSFGPICLNASNLVLSGVTPTGGVYSGVGMQDSVFVPLFTGSGIWPITYIAQDSLGCEDSATVSIHVYDTVDLNLTDSLSICANVDTVLLDMWSPFGGVYSGNGVFNNSFVPKIVGTGQHLINYEYTDINGCISEASSLVEVKPLPVLTEFTVDSICNNESAFELNLFYPTGGTYSGTGVDSNGWLDPSQLSKGLTSVYYNYKGTNGCTSYDTGQVHILPVTEIDLGEDTILCEGDYLFLGIQPPLPGILWSTGETSDSIEVAENGAYSVIGTNDYGCQSFDTIDVKFEVCLGISGESSVRGLQVYPNPASQVLHLVHPVGSYEKIEVRMFDVYGNEVKRLTMSSAVELVPVSDLAGGTYVLIAEFFESRWITSVVIQ